jgi:hypothetical protein
MVAVLSTIEKAGTLMALIKININFEAAVPHILPVGIAEKCL